MKWRVGVAAAVLLAAASSALAEDVRDPKAKPLVEQLLDSDAPAPDWRKVVKPEPSPGADASFEEILAFYFGGSGGTSSYSVESEKGPPAPDAAMVAAALKKVEAAPHFLAEAVSLLPEEDDTVKRVLAIYQKVTGGAWGQIKEKDRDAWAEAVADWLMERGQLRGKLVEIATKVEFGRSKVRTRPWELLEKYDWPQAEKVLTAKLKAKAPQLSTAALAQLYLHHARAKDAAATAEREQLKAWAADTKASGIVRDSAIEALMNTEWEGRDAWFESLLGDRTLQRCDEGDYMVYRPLAYVVRAAPDYWIPRLAKLVDKPGVVRDNAVTCLVAFNLEAARKDALEPLLPWLADPEWAQAPDRLRLVQSLDRVDLPASVPGLLWTLEHERSFELTGAADALAHYHAKEAVVPLRRAFAAAADWQTERSLAEALLALPAVSDAEIARGIERFARDVVAAGKEQWVERPSTRPAAKEAALGKYAMDVPREAVCELLLRRCSEVEPEVAAAIMEVVKKWPSAALDRQVAARLRGKLGESVVRTALDRAATLRVNAKDTLSELATGSGDAAGVAAALLGDPAVCRKILAGKDSAAQAMLLATARLMRAPLPLAAVAELLPSDSPLAARAAELYLVSEDSAAARQLVLARHPGEAQILGAWRGFDSEPMRSLIAGAHSGDEMEMELRRLVTSATGPREIYALFSGGTWGGEGSYILEIDKHGNGSLRIDMDGGKFRDRKLSAAELKELVDFVARRRIDELPPLNQAVLDGIQYTYVHLTKDGGRRVFMNNPNTSRGIGTVYPMLVARFRALKDTAAFVTHYEAFDAIPGAALVYDGSETPVNAIARQGTHLCVLTGDRGINGWNLFDGGKLGNPTEWPDGWSRLDFPDAPRSGDVFYEHLNGPPWRVRAGENVVRVYYSGMYRCREGKDRVLITKGEFARPVVTPDGKWAVVARSDQGWAKPHPLIRVNLATGEQLPLDVGAKDWSEPIIYLPVQGKVLVYQARRNERGEFWDQEHRLVDAATGKTELVKGEFLFESDAPRQLQPTGQPDEFWAAKASRDGTTLGRYDVRRFAFKPVLPVKGLRFSASETYVDEDGGVVYVAVRGDLLRIPLPREGGATKPGGP